MIAGVILSAGASSRMGTPKSNLSIGNSTFLNTILNRLSSGGFKPLLVVTGYHHREIIDAIDPGYHCRIFRNPHPEQGQLSSLQIAIRNLNPDISGILMVPVDHPLVQEDTYRRIFHLALAHPQNIIVPRYREHNGHPVYFSRKFFPDLLESLPAAGAREIIRNNPADVIRLPLEDQGILCDIDRPEDLSRYRDELAAITS
jgi:molybdenum cofactor cytidylyltransferase